MGMDAPLSPPPAIFLPTPMADQNRSITEIIVRERVRLGNFIRKRVPDPGDAEDIL